MKKWKVNSWRNCPVKHIPEYKDQEELNVVLGKLKNFPPLVFAGETRHLKDQQQILMEENLLVKLDILMISSQML